jgi:hypothetical protein
VIAGCGNDKTSPRKTNMKDTQEHTIESITCYDWSCIESNINEPAKIIGKLQEYSAPESGKGSKSIFYKWEILLRDHAKVPVQPMDRFLDLAPYQNKQVMIQGKIYFGTVVENTDPLAQSAMGYRIDLEKIFLQH